MGLGAALREVGKEVTELLSAVKSTAKALLPAATDDDEAAADEVVKLGLVLIRSEVGGDDLGLTTAVFAGCSLKAKSFLTA